jgi:hypothetical protein
VLDDDLQHDDVNMIPPPLHPQTQDSGWASLRPL